MKKPLVRLNAGQRGFLLIEALIAVLIFSVGVLGLVGLQGSATKYATDARFRTTANYLANQRIAQIWVADRATLKATFEKTDEPLSELPGGKRTVTVDASVPFQYVVAVTIDWTTPGNSATHHHRVVSEIHDKYNTLPL